MKENKKDKTNKKVLILYPSNELIFDEYLYRNGVLNFDYSFDEKLLDEMRECKYIKRVRIWNDDDEKINFLDNIFNDEYNNEIRTKYNSSDYKTDVLISCVNIPCKKENAYIWLIYNSTCKKIMDSKTEMPINANYMIVIPAKLWFNIFGPCVVTKYDANWKLMDMRLKDY